MQPSYAEGENRLIINQLLNNGLDVRQLCKPAFYKINRFLQFSQLIIHNSQKHTIIYKLCADDIYFNCTRQILIFDYPTPNDMQTCKLLYMVFVILLFCQCKTSRTGTIVKTSATASIVQEGFINCFEQGLT